MARVESRSNHKAAPSRQPDLDRMIASRRRSHRLLDRPYFHELRRLGIAQPLLPREKL